MGRHLQFDPDPEDGDFEEHETAIEQLKPYHDVSVKPHKVETVGEAAGILGINPDRFHALFREDSGHADDGTADSTEKASENGELVLSRDEVKTLCEFTHEVMEEIAATVDIDGIIERYNQVPAGEKVQDHLSEFELTMFKAHGVLSVISKMCEVAEEHELRMKVL